MELIGTMTDYLLKGGFVIFPILLTSVFMWTLIFERLLWFNRVNKKDIVFEEITGIITTSKIPLNKEGLKTFVIRDFLRQRSGNYTLDSRIIDESVIKLKHYLEKNIAAITILAAVSPLFGLLGTVTGMIDTFDVITFFGTGNPRAMAAGISEALVTTQTGLLVAIPGMFMSVLIYRKSKRANDSLNEAAMIIKRAIK